MSLRVEDTGTISYNNSTTTALGSNAVFTGTNDEVIGFANVSVFVFADQASATNGLQLQWSMDGTNYDDTDSYTIAASTGKVFTFGVQSRYVRVVYTNGASAQGAFRLQTIFHNIAPKPSSHRISDSISTENDAELVLAVQLDAANQRVSAIQGDAGLFRVSGFTATATNFSVSSVQADAGLQRVSSIVGDANNQHVSSVQTDAGLQRVSSIVGDANNQHVSSVQGDAGLQRVSAMVFGNTTGGLSIFRNTNLSSSIAAKGSAGAVYGWDAWNADTKPNYIKLFNTSGAINVGTDTPVMTIYLKASGNDSFFNSLGLKGFTNGIGLVSTSAMVDTATTGGTASATGINLFYI